MTRLAHRYFAGSLLLAASVGELGPLALDAGELEQSSSGRLALVIVGSSVTGDAGWSGQRVFVSTTCVGPTSSDPIANYGWGMTSPSVGGSTGNITFHHEFSGREAANVLNSNVFDFVGALNDDTITGTFDFASLQDGVTLSRVQTPVSLTKQTQ
jgi:hypothetical protein